MILVQLFISFFKIGLFSIGGGYVALPLIQNEVVTTHGWLNMAEFTDLITIAEMTPGPIAINSSTFVGTIMAGLPGGIIATLGCITPSCIIVTILGHLYYKYRNMEFMRGILWGLRPAVVSLIASAGISITATALFAENHVVESILGVNPVAFGIFLVALIILRKFKPSPIIIMASAGVIGGAIYLFLGRA